MSTINKLDIFGIQPKLYINNQSKFQTKFGVALTFSLLACLLVSCWVYGKDMIYREKPNTTFSEQVTKHPEKYDLNQETFNFAFGLQASDYSHFIDEQIYTLSLIQQIAYIQEVEVDGVKSTETVWESVDLKPRRCKASDFTIDTQYFQDLGFIEDLYCAEVKKDVFLEGDFGKKMFSLIKGRILPCQENCKPESEIKEKLEDGYWALYFTDQMVDPKKFENPFELAGRSEFGFSNVGMLRQLDMYFHNVYLEDNTGVIFDQIETKRGLSFDQTVINSKNAPAQNGMFLEFNIRLDKVKETKIYRTYLNLAEVIAKIGGILKVLMVGFMVFSWIISQKLFDLNLANQIFSFNFYENEKQEQSDQLEEESQSKNREIEKKKPLNFDNLWHIFFPCLQNKYEKEQNKLLQFAKGKIGENLNLNNILNKLQELEKLKMLLLTENQLKLFDYIPKPIINEKLIDRKNLMKNDLYRRQSSQRFNNILLENHKSQGQKNKEAFQAYSQICLQENQSDLDAKITDLMDHEIKVQFKEQLEKIVVEKEFEIFQRHKRETELQEQKKLQASEKLKKSDQNREKQQTDKFTDENSQKNSNNIDDQNEIYEQDVILSNRQAVDKSHQQFLRKDGENNNYNDNTNNFNNQDQNDMSFNQNNNIKNDLNDNINGDESNNISNFYNEGDLTGNIPQFHDTSRPLTNREGLMKNLDKDEI